MVAFWFIWHFIIPILNWPHKEPHQIQHDQVSHDLVHNQPSDQLQIQFWNEETTIIKQLNEHGNLYVHLKRYLSRINHVNNPISLFLLHSMPQSCHIWCIISVSSIWFLHSKWNLLTRNKYNFASFIQFNKSWLTLLGVRSVSLIFGLIFLPLLSKSLTIPGIKGW